MKLSVDNFFRSIQDRLGPQAINSDLNPSKYEHIKSLFQKFLTHNDRFGDCVDLNGQSLSCPANDGTGDYLNLQTDPTNFGMSVLNKGKNTWNDVGREISWVGADLHCVPVLLTKSNGFFPSYFYYHCSGELPERSNFSYSLSQHPNRCRETYYPPTDCPLNADCSPISSDCKNLHLFDQFLKQTPFQKISPLSRAWSHTKFGIGIVSTLCCAAETFQEIQKILNPPKPTSDNQLADKQSSSLKEKAIVPIAEQNKAAIEAAKKRALIYGIATIASAIFTAYTYTTDFADIYHTNGGVAGRFSPSV